ncbi:hypothetical protein D3C86_1539990 [compost metagenome]
MNRIWIADYTAVTIIDLVITVNVFKLNIAGKNVSPWITVVRYIRFQYIRSIWLKIKITILINTVECHSIKLSDRLSRNSNIGEGVVKIPPGYSRKQAWFIVVQGQHLVPVKCNIETGTPCEFLSFNVIAGDAEFYTTVRYLSYIFKCRQEAHTRCQGSIQQKVIRFFMVIIRG